MRQVAGARTQGDNDWMASVSPRPVAPVYWSDRSLLLYEGPVTTHYGKRIVDYDGSITFDWKPRPRVSWYGSSNQARDIHAVVDHHFSADPSVRVDIKLAMPPNPRRRGATRPSTVAAATLSDDGPCDG